MFLYLVQHAEAKGKEEDPARDLTEKGRQDVERVARYLKGLEVQVNPVAGVSEAPGLAPLDDPGIWAERLQNLDEDIMLVGHLPHLGRLAALLLSGDQERSVVNFQMGGVVRLGRLDAGQWAIDWMVVPAMVL